jgi:hypothetical protein
MGRVQWGRIVALSAIAGAWLGITLAVLLSVFADKGALDAHKWSLFAWESRYLVNGAVQRAGMLLHDYSRESDDEAVVRYFELTTLVRSLSESDDLGPVMEAVEDRSREENRVETILTRRIEEAIREVGLTEEVPLFGAEVIWPPVAFELTTPPSLLVISPRDHIERARSVLLEPDITFLEALEIEERYSDEDTSAIVIQIGGLAAYPAIVPSERNYGTVLSVAAHEWMHHYLAFQPLGAAYYDSGEMTTINETVANIFGDELSGAVREAYPLEFPFGDGSPPARQTGGIDFTQEMRRLRIQVDYLLETGRIAMAEALMESTRQRFADNGIFIRKLNQAYFAFHGNYGDSPASSSPIGPAIQEIRDLSPTLKDFIETMRAIDTPEELDEVLEKARSRAES